MKKTILIFGSLLCLGNANAQLRVGLQAGGSLSNANSNIINNLKGITFIQPGIIFDYNINNKFNIKPSINFLRNGFSLEDVAGTSSININTLQVPLDFSIPIKLGSGNLMVSAGPSLNYALGGLSKFVPKVGNATSNALSFGDPGELKRMNFGGDIGAGYAFKNGLELKANYNLGLTNQIADVSSGTTQVLKSNVATLLLAYYFIGNKSKK